MSLTTEYAHSKSLYTIPPPRQIPFKSLYRFVKSIKSSEPVNGNMQAMTCPGRGSGPRLSSPQDPSGSTFRARIHISSRHFYPRRRPGLASLDTPRMGAVFNIRDAHWKLTLTERNWSRDFVLNNTYTHSTLVCSFLGSMGHVRAVFGFLADCWCNYVHT